MRILILSDLHIGSKSRSKELCPYSIGENKDEKLVDTFIKSAEKYIDKSGPFDFLIIPGDITNQSNLIEFDCGSKFLSRIIDRLGIDKSCVLFVPGNHDIDWSVFEGKTIYPEELIFRKQHKYNTLKDQTHIFASLACPDLVTYPFIKKWEFNDVIFFGFNSAWDDDSIKVNHFGHIQMDQLLDLRTTIESTNFDNKLKIFLVHHHLHQFANLHPSWTDTSIMQNAQPLLEILTEFEFDFVIHGHRHQPYFHSLSINNSKSLNILCAGSYSCEVPSAIAGHVGNLFHIVELDNIQKCKGKTLSFAYNPNEGWKESRENDGIEFKNPFGNELSFKELIEECSSFLKDEFETKHYILFSEMVNIIPDLEYLQLTQKKKLLSQLEKDCNARLAIDSTQETIFINQNHE